MTSITAMMTLLYDVIPSVSRLSAFIRHPP